MGWLFGIPDFVGLFTYYNSLYDTENNTKVGGARKKQLAKKAQKALAGSAKSLSLSKNLKAANKFLKQVADSERAKEITLIQQFYEETKTALPEKL